jgi:hypothetical protein
MQTTNGISMFDEVIVSRIHLAIPYPRANLKTRRDIWKALFKKLEADQDRRYTVADPGGDAVIAGLIGSAGQAGKLLQPQTAIEDETKLRFSASSSDEDNKLRLNGRNIRNSKCYL